MFAFGMLGCAFSLLGGNHTAAIANLFMAVLWLYPDDTQTTAAAGRE
jgi:hypothetical protein